ncbi:MAG: response regulator [Gammaproteobacteria bacterium]|nr:response regulator [Gammaproteobacteria bacterium]
MSINYFYLETIRNTFSKEAIPFMGELITRLKMERPFKGKSIIYNGHLTRFSLIQIEALLLGGAQVTVVIENGLVIDQHVVADLQKANISLVRLSDLNDAEYDLALDCCGRLINHVHLKYGVVELTRSGTLAYESSKGVNYPVISIDDAQVKKIETFFGTADGFVRAFRYLTKHGLSYKKFVLFGYGKVGHGLVAALKKLQVEVVVIENDVNKKADALSQGVNCYLISEKEIVSEHLATAFAVVTATGQKGVMSKYYSAANFHSQFLVNLGAEDEWGEHFPDAAILNNKVAINFCLEQPTRVIFLDPIFCGQIRALEYLLPQKLSPGLHNFPIHLDLDLVTKWALWHSIAEIEGNYLQEIIANIPWYIYWKDQDSVYKGCNKAFAEAAGLSSSAEILGKTDYELAWSHEEADLYKKGDKTVLSGKLLLNLEETQRQANGQKIEVLASKVPYYDTEGHVIGVLGLYTDITDRKKAEQALIVAKEKAEAANEAKEVFLKNMRHDLRTPFSGILTLSEWMATQENDPKKKEHLQMISESAQVLLEYMNTILEQARNSEKLDFVVSEPIDLKNLILDAMRAVKPTVANKPIHMGFDYPNNLPTMINSDVSKLQRILLNLLGNAVKFTHEGEISIEVSILKQQQDQITLAISVKDTGIGVPLEKREAIFEKFTRLEAAYEGNYSGMGLGLHDVRQLCEQLRGTVSVSNNGIRGTVFSCTFPFSLTAQKHQHHQEQRDVTPKLSAHKSIAELPKLKILLVEDQPIAAYAASEVMRAVGHEVDIAPTAHAALEKFTSKKYDMVLLDIGLPDMDGIILAERLRKLERANQQSKTLLVALTAHQSDNEIDLKIFDRVINKPLSLLAVNQLAELVL